MSTEITLESFLTTSVPFRIVVDLYTHRPVAPPTELPFSDAGYMRRWLCVLADLQLFLLIHFDSSAIRWQARSHARPTKASFLELSSERVRWRDISIAEIIWGCGVSFGVPPQTTGLGSSSQQREILTL
jgi:hypothetical protein